MVDGNKKGKKRRERADWEGEENPRGIGRKRRGKMGKGRKRRGEVVNGEKRRGEMGKG